MIDMENVMMAEFTKKLGNGFEVEMVALFNKKRISNEEVVDLIQQESHNAYVVIMEKQQYANVFKL